MTISHKLVITLPDEHALNTTDGTITMTVEQAREWAQSILNATPTGITMREKVEKQAREVGQMARDLEKFHQKQREINAAWQAQAEHTPPTVDNLARTSGLFRKR